MKMAAIIPAYNEEKNIGNVLNTLKDIDGLSDILVVSDGSKDRTPEIAESMGIRTIQLPKNQGKGYAMWIGLQNTDATDVLFLDADLIGLKKQHVDRLILPLKENSADMALGIFTQGRGTTDLAQKLTPFLTGQRAVKRWVLDDLDEQDWTVGFGIEIALTRFAKENKLRVTNVHLDNVTHTMKEEKLGLARGMAARLKMYWEIARELNRF